MGPDPISIAGLAIAVGQVAAVLIQEYSQINHVPERLTKFQRCLRDFHYDATIFEEVLKQHHRPLTGIQNLQATLEESENLLRQYCQKFRDRNLVKRGYNALKLHYRDEGRLDELTREIDSQYLRLIYRSQLILHLPQTFLSEINAANPRSSISATSSSSSQVHHSDTASTVSADDYLERKARSQPLLSDDISHIFNSKMADLVTCDASVELTLVREDGRLRRFKLSQHKVLARDDSNRTLVWLNKTKTVMLEHKLPRGTIPWTDTCFDKYEVSFPFQVHRFTRTDIYGIHQHHVTNPTYMFKSREDQIQFQGDVRERDLLGTFEASSIVAKRRHTIRGLTNGTRLTDGQFVKIWAPRDRSKHPSFTFWVNYAEDPKHYEYDVLCFKTIRCNHRSKVVTLAIDVEAIPSNDLEDYWFDIMDIQFLSREDLDEFIEQFNTARRSCL